MHKQTDKKIKQTQPKTTSDKIIVYQNYNVTPVNTINLNKINKSLYVFLDVRDNSLIKN